MPPSLLLVPNPRHLTYTGGYYPLKDRLFVVISEEVLRELSFPANRFLSFLHAKLGMKWKLVPESSIREDQGGLFLRVQPDKKIKEQGYSLSISPNHISIIATSNPGVFYGICTLIQLIEQCGAMLPCLQVEDWPDFPVRGVMLDISRDKVPTMETLFSLVDMLAGWKINQFQLYTEHTFAYSQHQKVWENASPITGEEILELDRYCKDRYIELVPNQNSFGHMRRWLTHDGYAQLAEIHGPFETPWGLEEGPFSLCPVDPDSQTFVKSLYDELLPFFSSRMANVGCDETFDLGQGRSRESCIQQGTGQVYLDFLLGIYQDLKKRGFTMQFWGDIILRYPELIPKLPKDLVALDWGYEAEHPFETNAAQLSATGIPYYVCPGTSSWCSLAGRTENALGNLKNAARSGHKNGASGYLITDWGDNGHWQFLPVSYLGFIAGAAYSWGYESNEDLDIPAALDQYAFHDKASVLGRVAYDLGNVYKAVGLTPINSSVLFTILQRPLSVLETREYLHPVPFECVLEAINQAVLPLSKAEIESKDHALISHEFELTAQLLRHACYRGMLAVQRAVPSRQYPVTSRSIEVLEQEMHQFIQSYQQVWLERNRPGGLPDSVKRLERIYLDYREPQAFSLRVFP